MAKVSNLSNTFNTIKEVDLRPLRQQALNGVRISIVGAPGSGRSTLAAQLRRDPSRPENQTDSPVLILDLEQAAQASGADLIILVVDHRKLDTTLEQTLAQQWANANQRVLILLNEFEEPQGSKSMIAWSTWSRRRVVNGSVLDEHFLANRFAGVVIDLLPSHVLGLGRAFPLFRVAVAHYLINDTSLSNAAYSLSTGLAEIVPIFDIPLNVADMVVLTKTQAYLVYKLGLAFGFSTQWQDYVAEFSSVLGAGFLWRQIARSLVGLIPVYGIIPKVAVAYSGTYAVGHAVLQWYITGRHISTRQMRELYSQAFQRGKAIGARLLEKAPRPHLPKMKLPRLPRRSAQKDALPALPAQSAVFKTCPQCAKESAADAAFCQYCGHSLDSPES